MKIHLLLVFALLFTASGFSQSSYTSSGSIGSTKKTTREEINILPYRTNEQIVGEKFIFMPQRKSMQRFAYQMIFKENPLGDEVTYNECAGVICVVENTGGLFNKEITLRDTQSNRKFVSDGYPMKELASIADIDSCRSRFLQRTLWFKKNKLTTFDEEKDVEGIINITRYSAVKVVDIVVGWTNLTPVRFILQTVNNEIGFVDINVSGTNMIYENQNLFDDYFLAENPRVRYSWDAATWSAIENEKVFIGMTNEQIIMSWGKPMDIRKTIYQESQYDRWIYEGRQHLYLREGKIFLIQE